MNALGSDEVSFGRPVALAARGGGDAPRLYKALAKINIRVAPDIKAAKLAGAMSQKLKSGEWISAIEAGEVFEVSEERRVDGQVYLKLTNQDGWVFSRGVAGQWADRDIVAPVAEEDAMNERAKGFVNSVQRRLVRDESDQFVLWALGVVVAIGLFGSFVVATN